MVDMNGFDADKVHPNTGFDPIPSANYEAVITKSEMKPTKAGTGQYLELTFQVVDGQYKGRQLWARLNLQNPNSEAVRIAQGDLSSICRAVKVLQPKDSAQLHGLPMIIKVNCKKENDGTIRNEIKGFYPKPESTPAVVQTSGESPWGKK